MSDEIKEEPLPPLEVKITNHVKEKDVHEILDREYDDLFISDDEIKEFEDGSSSK